MLPIERLTATRARPRHLFATHSKIEKPFLFSLITAF
jgi:hypothetical protein